jgi:PadR family transcriptional regulator, regulatory protein PadR
VTSISGTAVTGTGENVAPGARGVYGRGRRDFDTAAARRAWIAARDAENVLDSPRSRTHSASRLWIQTLGGDVAQPLSLVKGTLDLLVLKALAWQPMHGFEIANWLEERSAGALDVDDSALYQGLYRLEARELIAAEWGITENGRRARYYKVTARGRAHLRQETATWVRYSETVTGILTGPQGA